MALPFRFLPISRRVPFAFLVPLLLLPHLSPAANPANPLRLPGVPLVTHDPYLSVWSVSDRLYDDWPKHWTLKPHAMCGMIRVDGKTMRFMGDNRDVSQTVRQKSLDVRATQTVYTFDAQGVSLTVTFTSPLLLDDLDLLSRPVTYITFDARSADGKPHEVQLYFDACAEWAVNTVKQGVNWNRLAADGLDAMAAGSADQKVLATRGDDLRIDWGHLLVASPAGVGKTAAGPTKATRDAFVETGHTAPADDPAMPKPVADDFPGLSVSFDLGALSADPVRRHVLVGYDDEFSVQYFGRNLRPWWRRGADMTAEKMLAQAEKDYAPVLARCDAFDKKLVEDLSAVKNDEYTKVCVAVYRQAIAAHKLVAAPDGRPLFFSKENNSNGSICTVDVTYPSAPLFLIYNPALVKGMCDPIFDYAESGKWTKPFAPHDLGTYPQANGQTYPTDMPVEECGNMILLAAAVCAAEGKPDYAKAHWETLTKWAHYLKEHGFDPANQLCTDDFAGHLARNANLSVKAILALAAYGRMGGRLGNAVVQDDYLTLARGLARQWTDLANDGDHYALAFGAKKTWSQKYNLVWDKVLALDVFPPSVARTELAFYSTKQLAYGLPLDSRKTWTKPDWILWTATLAESDADFARFVHPVYNYINETPTRWPLSDWYLADTGKARGFRARSVVGGFYMKLLDLRLRQSRQ